MAKKLTKGIRKYIRREKARLRREILNKAEQSERIDQIYRKIGVKREKVNSSQSTKTNRSSPPQKGLPKKK